MTNEVAQKSNEWVKDKFSSSPKIRKLCRKVGAEGCVLVKNNNAALPINGEQVSLFGRCQIDYFYVGYGSGGEVNAPYRVSLLEGLINNNFKLDEALVKKYQKWCNENIPDNGTWGNWPRYYEEMFLLEEDVKKSAKFSKKAIVVIGRSSGEDRENKLERGSIYLTKIEESNLKLIRKYFEQVIVIINSGSIIDLEFVEEFNIDAVLIAWQGGQESGNSVADVLCGKVNPCGKLTDTIAIVSDYLSTKNFGNMDFNNYEEDIYVGYRGFETFSELREKVIYPFGFGLSYSKFELININISKKQNSIVLNVDVRNIGNCSGREVVQVYFKAPNGKLGKPFRELIRYKKTENLRPNEMETLVFTISLDELCCFDDSGITGYKNCFILEEGIYELYIGTDVRSSEKVYEFFSDFKFLKKVNEICGVKDSFKRLVNQEGKMFLENVTIRENDIKSIILNNLPRTISFSGDLGYKLSDVKQGNVSIENFVAQLSDDELEAITRGGLEGMQSFRGIPGNAGVFGGNSEELINKGIPTISTNDGPSGLRLKAQSTLLPIGTALACTYDDELIEELLYELGLEESERKGHVLLAPGLNIHRNPLCGRNFEYFSEDPYLTGKIGAAYIRGFQKANVSATPKHFCCNNQEINRVYNDSRVSTRALREIYWKGFEIAIKEASPDCIMMSYNKINGVYSYYNYELVTMLLKEEWDYKGIIMTDWWIKPGKSPEFSSIFNHAYRVRAQVDLFMPGSNNYDDFLLKTDGSIIESLNCDDGLTRGELQRCAITILKFCFKYL